MPESGSKEMPKCPRCKHFMICHDGPNGECGVRIGPEQARFIDMPKCGCKYSEVNANA